MATHSHSLTREIPWTEEPGGLIVHGAAKESDMIYQLNNYNNHKGKLPKWKK